jgi:hypothetical protein
VGEKMPDGDPGGDTAPPENWLQEFLDLSFVEAGQLLFSFYKNRTF